MNVVYGHDWVFRYCMSLVDNAKKCYIVSNFYIVTEMISTVVKIEISTQGMLGDRFIGGIFRGWLGYVLKCDRKRSCAACDESSNCPYFMVFKEKTGVRPYSTLAFVDRDRVSGFIRLYGDKRRFAPKILSAIKMKEKKTHFGGLRYTIDSIEAKNQDIKTVELGSKLKIVTTSLMHLTRNKIFEVIPTFNTILRSSVRSYNRIAKYHDEKNYPYHVDNEIMNVDAEILDFDVHTIDHVHTTMNHKRLILSGIDGWITYDTSDMPEEVGKILGMGEALQIGKHTAYGFGGFIALSQEE